MSAQTKLAQQAQGIRYGCHADLFDDDEPDECVITTGHHADCIFATRVGTREACQYWQPIASAKEEGV